MQQFFESGGHSLVREIERQRDDASTNLDFEAAAALHTRLEKVKAAAAQLPDIVRRLDELNGVMVQPSADRESVALFKIAAGRICAPVALNVGQPAGAAARLEAAVAWSRASPRRWPRWKPPSCAGRWSGWSTWRC